VGALCGDANTTGQNNNALGLNALGANTTGSQNVAIGGSAVGSARRANTTGNDNVAVGCISQFDTTTGSNNTSIGTRALQGNTTADNNTAVGHSALQANTTGASNVGVGYLSGVNQTTGSTNTFIGAQAGRYRGSGTDTLTIASSSVFIGHQSRANDNSQTNQVVIAGTNGLGDGSNTTVIGTTATTSTRIPAGNLTLSNGNLILGTAGNGISFAATTDPTIAAVAATGFITRTATNVANNDTVTIGTTVYTFKTTLTPADYEVLIGADSSASLTNLRNAINNSGGTPGTDYVVPNAHPSVTASAIVGSVLPLVAITAGTTGNSIALAETSAQLSVGAATLLGGRDAQGMSGELLDDYEVGTWTPAYFAQTGSFASIATEVFTATYVKIGKSVTVNALIETDGFSIGTASGQIRISGLPYTPTGQSAGATTYVGAARASSWGTNSPTLINASAGSTNLIPSHRTSITGADVFTSVTDLSTTSNGVNRNVLTFTITYIVA
jgi:hypothetical protein